MTVWAFKEERTKANNTDKESKAHIFKSEIESAQRNKSQKVQENSTSQVAKSAQADKA